MSKFDSNIPPIFFLRLWILSALIFTASCVREYTIRYDHPTLGGARIFTLDSDVGGRTISASNKIGNVTQEDCEYGIYQVTARVPFARRKTSIEIQCITPPVEDDGDNFLGSDDPTTP